MAQRTHRHLLLYVGAFAGPLVMIRLLGGVTATSVASTGEQSEAFAPTPAAILRTTSDITEEELKAAAHVLALRDQPFGEFPFVFKPPAARTVAPVERRGLAVEINAILRTSSGPKAMINEMMVQPGDTVSNGEWVVESIDTDARSVVFREQSTGRLVTKIVAPIL